MMDRIDQAIALQHSVGRHAARERFAVLWEELGPAGDSLCRCRLAHHMADLQEDLHEELAWDLRALEAADQVTGDDHGGAHGVVNIAAFYPSLHLNLAEDYRKLGALAKAREHVERAEASIDVLGTSEYGAMIRAGIARIRQRLTSSSTDEP